MFNKFVFRSFMGKVFALNEKIQIWVLVIKFDFHLIETCFEKLALGGKHLFWQSRVNIY